MVVHPYHPAAAAQPAQTPLAECLIALAGTPDDSSWIEPQFIAVAQLSADLIGPVTHASVTAYRDDSYRTVADSGPIAVALDEAQYVEQAGPCLDAIDNGSPVAVRDMSAVTAWPGLHVAAAEAAIQASLSIPLFAGRGLSIAALNLYADDRAAMAPLIGAVLAAYDPADATVPAGAPNLQHGGAELLAGISGAFAVRGLIQQAIGVLVTDRHITVDRAYVELRLRAAETGVPLTDTAAAVIAERQWLS
jgi:hypothetical protein